MEGDGGVKEFPDVTHKLAAPKKLSAFEKARQEDAAKRQRAEAENAAALKAFESSFGHGDADDDIDDDDDPLVNVVVDRAPPSGPRGGGFRHDPPGPGGRSGVPPSRPWSESQVLGGMQGPPPQSLRHRRALDERREREEAMRPSDEPEFEDSDSDLQHDRRSSRPDEEHQVEIPKPTIRLSNLPPEMRDAEVRALLRPHLDVHSIDFLPPVGPGTSGRRSSSVIVTLSAETSRAKIESAITVLKSKYLGLGYNLSMSRHLSSTSLHPSVGAVSARESDAPFGAEEPQQVAQSSMRNAPSSVDYAGFAPPESYEFPSRTPYDETPRPDAGVNVRIPLDVETIRAVHAVVDALLSESGPEQAAFLEMQLMECPEVQNDEHFSFLFDSRSPAGLYYRYLLWNPEDSDEAERKQKKQARSAERIYDDIVMDWVSPQNYLPFPEMTDLAQAVTDLDYVSSDEESDDEGGEPRPNGGRDGELALEGTEKKQLSPLKRARLIHLLARLPTSMAVLLKGDVARVTSFAINYAGPGAEEIADLLLLNVHRPLSHSLASQFEDSDHSQDSEDEYEPGEELPAVDADAPDVATKRESEDPSNAKLVALYVISDLLSAASTAGARNAWKYRQLFEAGFKLQKTFEHLGKLDKELSWGRFKAEQWKRKIGVIFGIWEGWSVFNSDALEQMKKSFFEPPLSEEEKLAEDTEKQTQETRRVRDKMAGKFKRAGQDAASGQSASPAPPPENHVMEERRKQEEAGIERMDLSEGPLLKREAEEVSLTDSMEGIRFKGEADRRAMIKADVGNFGLDGAADTKPTTEGTSAKMDFTMSTVDKASSPVKPPGPRKRMRAEDMFANSDEE